MSQFISWNTPKTSAARPTPCLPSRAVARKLWAAMMSLLLRSGSRSRIVCRRAQHRPVLPLRLPCEEVSAFSPRFGSPISRNRAKSGAYSRAPLLPPFSRDSAAAICLPLPLGQMVRSMGLHEITPSTPSGALLVDQVTRAVFCWRWQSLEVFQPRFTSSSDLRPGRKVIEVVPGETNIKYKIEQSAKPKSVLKLFQESLCIEGTVYCRDLVTKLSW